MPSPFPALYILLTFVSAFRSSEFARFKKREKSKGAFAHRSRSHAGPFQNGPVSAPVPAQLQTPMSDSSQPPEALLTPPISTLAPGPLRAFSRPPAAAPDAPVSAPVDHALQQAPPSIAPEASILQARGETSNHTGAIVGGECSLYHIGMSWGLSRFEESKDVATDALL